MTNAPDPLANLSPAARRVQRATDRANLRSKAKADRAAAPVAAARASIELVNIGRLGLVEAKRTVALLTQVHNGLVELNAHFGDLVNELQADKPPTEVGE